MVSGFILIQPGAEIARQIDLLLHLDDPAHVARYREFEDWFRHTQDVPGAFYLWIVRHLFRDNSLMSGSLRVRGQKVDLARIDMPLNLLAGATRGQCSRSDSCPMNSPRRGVSALPSRVAIGKDPENQGGPMADRTQRVKGKAEETKGRLKRETGQATGRPGTEARGAAEELKGKAKNAVGKARSAVKKSTR